MSTSFELGLTAYLRSYAGLFALIGQRIHPLVLPDPPTLPAVVYQLISDTGDVAHDGALELSDARYQFDAWAETYIQAKQVADQLRAALLGYSGPMGSFHSVIPQRERGNDFYERETGLYRVSVDYRIWFKPA